MGTADDKRLRYVPELAPGKNRASNVPIVITKAALVEIVWGSSSLTRLLAKSIQLLVPLC